MANSIYRISFFFRNQPNTFFNSKPHIDTHTKWLLIWLYNNNDSVFWFCHCLFLFLKIIIITLKKELELEIGSLNYVSSSLLSFWNQNEYFPTELFDFFSATATATVWISSSSYSDHYTGEIFFFPKLFQHNRNHHHNVLLSI